MGSLDLSGGCATIREYGVGDVFTVPFDLTRSSAVRNQTVDLITRRSLLFPFDTRLEVVELLEIDDPIAVASVSFSLDGS
ncbi:MAG: hypothetical protein WC604_04190, partial [Candidatus Gracilibacteria bacterium]